MGGITNSTHVSEQTRGDSEGQGCLGFAGHGIAVSHDLATEPRNNVYLCCAQSCPTLCDSMDCSPPGSAVCRIFQARILKWAAVSSSRGSSQPGDQTHVPCVSPCIGRWILYQ